MSDFAPGLGCGLLLAYVASTLIPSASADPHQLDWADRVCETNQGVKALRPAGRVFLPAKVRCRNGATFIFTKQALADHRKENTDG